MHCYSGNVDEDQLYKYPDADPYLNEDEVFLEAVRTGNKSLIRSTYSDAAKTYLLSWGIRSASELNWISHKYCYKLFMLLTTCIPHKL